MTCHEDIHLSLSYPHMCTNYRLCKLLSKTQESEIIGYLIDWPHKAIIGLKKIHIASVL